MPHVVATTPRPQLLIINCMSLAVEIPMRARVLRMPLFCPSTCMIFKLTPGRLYPIISQLGVEVALLRPIMVNYS